MNMDTWILNMEGKHVVFINNNVLICGRALLCRLAGKLDKT